MGRIFDKLKESIADPKHGLEVLLRNTICHLYSDESWIQLVAKIRFGRKFDLVNPITFNEKLNWLKLHDHNPQYNVMADKYEVKKYVANLIGMDYVVPCYGVWDRFENINFDDLPNSFVLKCTHDSSGATICKDKANFDMDSTRKKMNRYLKRNNYWHLREWVYKDISPRIIAEQFLDDGSGHELRDYKFWCFNGEPQIMYCTNKASNIYENFYDMEFQPIYVNHGFRRQLPEFPKPKEFDLMKQLARNLSAGIPFVRVDFFDVCGKIYFGEFTFYDWGGGRPFEGDWDQIIGEMIKLPDYA